MAVADHLKVLQDHSQPNYRRLYAVQKLIDEGTDQAIAGICKALKEDPDSIVRHECAFVLGEVGAKEGVPALAEAALKDKSPLVRHESAEALGWIPTKESAEALQKALEDPIEEVRLTAKMSLNIHKDPKE